MLDSNWSLAIPASTSPRVLFLGTTYAGWATQFANLQADVLSDGRLDPTFRSVSGWREGGLFERLPLPAGLSGRLRALTEAAPFASLPRPDAIWLSASELVTPYLWSQLGPLRRPVVLDLDATPAQLEAMAQPYFGRPPKSGLRRILARANDRLMRSTVTAYTAWSRWAADGLRAEGVPPKQIHVIPPGVDLDAWQVSPRPPRDPAAPLKLLFVGNNVVRKGGDLLLELMRSPWGSQFELDLVTGEDLAANAPNVRVHRASPNSPELRRLFAGADLFVLPTRAECFGIASVEAMASGLPVIMGDVGGARDIVDDGATGWLIKPTREGLRDALGHALAVRESLPLMGARARATAEARFDGRTNHGRIIDLLIDLCGPSGERNPASAKLAG